MGKACPLCTGTADASGDSAGPPVMIHNRHARLWIAASSAFAALLDSPWVNPQSEMRPSRRRFAPPHRSSALTRWGLTSSGRDCAMPYKVRQFHKSMVLRGGQCSTVNSAILEHELREGCLGLTGRGANLRARQDQLGLCPPS